MVILMVRSATIVALLTMRPKTDQHTSRICPSFAGLVVLAGSLYPIPSRTRPLNSSAPMVLSLKAWKSRSLPDLPRTDNLLVTMIDIRTAARDGGRLYLRRHPAARGKTAFGKSPRIFVSRL